MKHSEKPGSSKLLSLREFMLALSSQPFLSYPILFFLTLGAGATGYHVIQKRLDQKIEKRRRDLDKILPSGFPVQSDHNELQTNVNPATIHSETLTTTPDLSANTEGESIDLEKEFREMMSNNINRALENDYNFLLAIKKMLENGEKERAIEEFLELRSSLDLYVRLNEYPTNLDQKEKALRNIHLLKSLLEKLAPEVPLLSHSKMQQEVLQFLRGYIHIGALFQDQAEIDFASLLQTNERELLEAFRGAIKKAEGKKMEASMEDMRTMLRNFSTYPEHIKDQLAQLIREYIQNFDIEGTRRLQVSGQFKEMIKRNYRDLPKRERLLSDLPDLSSYQKEIEINEALMNNRMTPDEQALNLIVENLRILKQYLTREEYLSILERAHSHAVVYMAVISRSEPDEGKELRANWFKWKIFLDQIRPLFSEIGAAPDENPWLTTRPPE